MNEPNDDLPEDLIRQLEKEGLIEVTQDEPVAEPAPETAPEPAQAAPEPIQAEAPAEPFEGYSALPEAARKIVDDRLAAAAKAEELEQRARNAERDRLAVQGRLAPAQRELEVARKRLAEIDEASRKNATSAAREKLDRYKEQFPDEAAPLDAVYGELRSDMEKFREEREAMAAELTAMRREAYVQKARSEIQRIHPDYHEIEDGPQSDDFYAWLDTAPGNKRLLELGGVENTAEVVTNYKRDKELARFYTQSGQSTAAPTPANKPLARAAVDPNPVLRKTTGVSRSGTASTSDEEENYANAVAELRAQGVPI